MIVGKHLGGGSHGVQLRLFFLGDAGQKFLDLGDGFARVQTLGAGLGAVHDGVAAIDRERVLQLVQALGGMLITGVDDPAVGLHEHGGAEVLVAVPPIGRAGCGAARAQDALVETVEFLSVVSVLQVLLVAGLQAVVPLQPRLDGPVLLVEVVHVRHQVLDDVHVGQGVDLGGLAQVGVDLADAGESVDTADVHGAGAADALPARPTQRQGWVDLVLDLDQCVQHHGAAAVEVDLIGLHPRLVPGQLRVPAIHGDLLHPLLGRSDGSGGAHHASTAHSLD